MRELAKYVCCIMDVLCEQSMLYNTHCSSIWQSLLSLYIPCRECNICELLLDFLSCGDEKLVHININMYRNSINQSILDKSPRQEVVLTYLIPCHVYWSIKH